MCQNFYYYFIYFFSLLPTHISLSVWFSLSTLIFVVSLFPQSFSNANANSRSPSKTKPKNSLKITQKQNRRSIFFVDFPNSPSLFGTPSQPSISLTLTQTLIFVYPSLLLFHNHVDLTTVTTTPRHWASGHPPHHTMLHRRACRTICHAVKLVVVAFFVVVGRLWGSGLSKGIGGWVVAASCAWVWWWRAMLGMVGFCWRFWGFFFFFFPPLLLRFLDLEFVGGLVVVAVVVVAVVHGWWWLPGLCVCILLGFE